MRWEGYTRRDSPGASSFREENKRNLSRRARRRPNNDNPRRSSRDTDRSASRNYRGDHRGNATGGQQYRDDNREVYRDSDGVGYDYDYVRRRRFSRDALRGDSRDAQRRDNRDAHRSFPRDARRRDNLDSRRRDSRDEHPRDNPFVKHGDRDTRDELRRENRSSCRGDSRDEHRRDSRHARPRGSRDSRCASSSRGSLDSDRDGRRGRHQNWEKTGAPRLFREFEALCEQSKYIHKPSIGHMRVWARAYKRLVEDGDISGGWVCSTLSNMQTQTWTFTTHAKWKAYVRTEGLR